MNDGKDSPADRAQPDTKGKTWAIVETCITDDGATLLVVLRDGRKLLGLKLNADKLANRT